MTPTHRVADRRTAVIGVREGPAGSLSAATPCREATGRTGRPHPEATLAIADEAFGESDEDESRTHNIDAGVFRLTVDVLAYAQKHERAKRRCRPVSIRPKQKRAARWLALLQTRS